MFSLDYNKLILWVVPAFNRKPVLYAWVQSLCYPIVQLYDLFIIKRSENLYKIDHNGQVYSLQNVLNDRFDNAERRIYIGDGLTKDRTYLYTRLEDKPEYLGAIYLHNRADYTDTGVDFIVWVPLAVPIIAEDRIEMKALLNFYKLAGKRYQIYRI